MVELARTWPEYRRACGGRYGRAWSHVLHEAECLDSAATPGVSQYSSGLNPVDVAGYTPVSVSHADGLRLQLRMTHGS